MSDWRQRLESAKRLSTCRLTTCGRRTGRPHIVTIWFAIGEDGRVYLATLRMGRDWPKNVLANPEVTLTLGELRLRGQARLLTDERQRARVDSLIAGKYWGARIAGWLGFKPQGAFELRVDGEAA
ncbi:MAG: pyridoxamine 5'-phosphate oxidase family protein [Deltaproteobacteria bacterium]|nr:pyridoxamine 5'-phosphate oxidase family protein [Deltaproteobacteria bacterium]